MTQPEERHQAPRAIANDRYGTHGKVLHVDLTTGATRVEHVDESVYQQFLGGYGLGAWLMWKHFPAGTDALAPEACFAIVSGLLTGVKTPFSGRIQIVGKSPLTDGVGRQQLGRQRREPAPRRGLRRRSSCRAAPRSRACWSCATARRASSRRATSGARKCPRPSTSLRQRYGGKLRGRRLRHRPRRRRSSRASRR